MRLQRGGRLWFALVLGLLSTVARGARDDAPHPSVDALVARARQQDLAHSPAWLQLGHWRPRFPAFLHRYESQADGRDFFLSREGALDPEAELVATLRGLFAPVAEQSEGEDAAAPVRCRFPARERYLRTALGIDAAELPDVPCPRYRAFVADLDAESVSLIFSSYFLDNPASAFGHTLLRVNRRGSAQAGERRELLDTGIDFGANVDDDNALVYAVKGIVGLYPATFRSLPYYYKVRQYGDYESRDLWEYRLALDPAQLEMLIAHLWELGSTHFDYYYFTENCSYHVLGAIAAAVPEAGLLERVHAPVIPSDTVETLAETDGLVAEVGYRPSLRTLFLARAAGLVPAERPVVARLAADPDAPLPENLPRDRRIAVLDAAADLFDVRHAKALIRSRDPDIAASRRRLLARRADVLGPSAPLEISIPRAKAPDRGHPSRRLSLGPALDDASNAAVAIGFRFALHDLADPSDGYPETAQIEMGAFDLRVSLGDRPRVRLDDFSIVRIVSLNSLDRFFRLPSWHVQFGARSVEDGACRSCEVATASAGVGAAHSAFGERLTLFAFADARVEAGHSLAGIAGEAVRAGLGPAAGMRLALHPRLHGLVTGSWLWHPAQHPKAPFRARATLRWGIARDYALSLEGVAERGMRRAQLVAQLYF